MTKLKERRRLLMSQTAVSGLELIGSGTYTKTGGTNMVIPVTYTGTPVYFIVCIAQRSPDTAQQAAVAALIEPPDNRALDFFPNGVGAYVEAHYTAANSLGYSSFTSLSAPVLDTTAGTLSVYRSGSQYPQLNGQYEWYIYGRRE